VVLAIFSSVEVFDFICALLAALAVYEIYTAFATRGFKPVYIAGYIACVCIFLGSIEYWDRRVWGWLRSIILFVDIRLLFYLSLLLMFCFLIAGKGGYTVADLSVSILGAFYICFLFWYLIMSRNLPGGEFAVLFILLAAVATDTCAYFVGTFFGKHKLIVEISKNKTVEGAVGGALACVAVVTLYGAFVYNRVTEPSPIWLYLVMGVTCGVVAQIGDLAASCVKRYCGIKDFGKLIPGHGGILDRMDSALLLSPLVYFFLSVMAKV